VTTVIADDEDTAIDQFVDPGDDDDDDNEVTAETSTRGRASSYEDAERKFNATAERQIVKYDAFLAEKRKARLAVLAHRVQAKLDEWAMAHVGTGQVQNPQAVAESLARQVAATESRLTQIREQLASLAESGVDVSAIQASMEAAASA
jgi:hypothetical protein